MFGRKRIAELEAEVADLEDDKLRLLRTIKDLVDGNIGNPQNVVTNLRAFHPEEFARIDADEKWADEVLFKGISRNTKEGQKDG